MKSKLWATVILSFLLSIISLSPVIAASNRDPLNGQNLFRDVERYVRLGDHRTATVGDYRTAGWLKNSLRRAGYDTRTQRWSTRQFYPLKTRVIIDHKTHLQGFPVWWPKPTDFRGITGQLSQDIENTDGKIYLFVNLSEATFTVTEQFQETIETAWNNGAVGVIVVTYYAGTDSIASDEFIGLNAEQDIQKQWPVPVVSVMARDFEHLQDALDHQSKVTLISAGIYNDHATGLNVIATLDRGPGSNKVVVTTPYSGWFTCAGERGSGIAIFLGLARWAAENTKNTTWVFTATSGHELKALGIEDYLQKGTAPAPDDILCWVHLGAWQAMYNYVVQDGVLVPTKDLDLRYMQYRGYPAMASAVGQNFSSPDLNITLIPTVLFGDLLEVENFGYQNLWGITYGHEFHHSTQDLPVVTGPEILEPTARAYQGALLDIIGE